MGSPQGRAGLVWFLHRLSRKEGSVHHHMPPLCSVCTIICLHYHTAHPLSASSIICQTSCMCRAPNVEEAECFFVQHISKRRVCSLPPDISLKCLLLFLSENAKHKKCRQFLGGTAIRLCQITVQVIFTVSEIVLLSDLSKTSSLGFNQDTQFVSFSVPSTNSHKDRQSQWSQKM